MGTRALICPMSTERIDKNVVRITAVITAVVLATAVALAAVSDEILLAIAIAVAADFAVRVVSSRPSPIGWIAARLAARLHLRAEPMDRAPKMFAVRVGLIMAVAAVALFFVSPWAAAGVALGLMAFNLLDGLVDLCVGCYIYTYVVLPTFGED